MNLRIRLLTEAERDADEAPPFPIIAVVVGDDRQPAVLETFNGRAWVPVPIAP